MLDLIYQARRHLDLGEAIVMVTVAQSRAPHHGMLVLAC